MSSPSDRDPHANIGSWLRQRAESQPERPALVRAASGDTLSYAALNDLTNRIAARMRELGAAEGERVALGIASGPTYLACYFAAAKLGAILLPLNTRLAAPEVAFQLQDADVRLALYDDTARIPERQGTRRVRIEELLGSLPASAPEPTPTPGGDAPHALLYTSGTTGSPKGALLPHRKTYYNSLNAERFFGLTRDDVVIIPVPLFHSYGLKILSVPTLFCGATAVLVDRFDPVELQALVARYRGTLLGAVPIMYQRMLRAGLDEKSLATLRLAFSAGAPLEPSLVKSYHDLGIPLIEGYGQTETSILCCMDPERSLAKAGSVGRPVANVELRIADDTGKCVSPGETGEIQVRGPIVMLGYWRKPEASEAARQDGWHRTGDLGTQDAEGYVRLTGRRSDMYISGGENVYPAEIERVLEQHPSIVEAAVVGLPDPDWGETGYAFVVSSEPIDAEALTRYVRERLASYKCPRKWVQVESLPRTASGKVQKHRLVTDPC